MHSVLSNSFIRGAIAGALSAAVVDLHAFLKWRSFHDAATYDWNTATFRWLQGAVVGALGGGGFNMVIGS